jgi:APA family basic amino acid/polyamine antiporter
MVVTEVVGVGIFLSPATMTRTLGGLGPALAIWTLMGALSTAGALCYAELTTRFPRAGGAYVFLREAFGPRTAFLYGWMALLVVDPGLAAALAIGLAEHLLATSGAAAGWLVPTAIACLVALGWLTLAGLQASARVLRWTAGAKLALVAIFVAAGLAHGRTIIGSAGARAITSIPSDALAAAVLAAFFAFGGWWEVGRMSEEVETPRRTMPLALVGGVALVTAVYALVTVAFFVVAPAPAASDQALVSQVGNALFGRAGGRLLPAMVSVAVAGSLAAVLFGSPRVYMAMARDGLFPRRVGRFDARRGSVPGGTVVQVTLACLLVTLGTFDQILGYFVPAVVFFLGLSAAAVIVLPRPHADASIFRAPLHPLPIVSFLALIAAVLVLFLIGQPRQTLLGAGVVLLGIPASWLVIPRRPAAL